MVLFLILFFISISILSLLNIRLAVLVTFAVYILVPYYIAADFGPSFPLINFERVAILIVVSIWLLERILRSEPLFQSGIGKKINRNIKFLAFVFLLSVFLSVDITISVMNYITFFFYNFLWFYLVYQMFSTEMEIEKLITLFLVCTTIVGIIAWCEHFFDFNPYKFLPAVQREGLLTIDQIQTRLGEVRAEAGFGHSITMGSFFVFMIPLLLHRLRLSNYKSLKYVVLLILFLGALFFTYSRAAWLGFIVMLLYILKKNIRRHYRTIIAALVVSLFGFFIFVDENSPLFELIGQSIFFWQNLNWSTVANLGSRYNLGHITGSEFAGGTLGRVLIFVNGFKLFLVKPLLGYGYSMGSIVMYKNTTFVADSYYVWLTLSTGILGLFAYLKLMINFLSTLNKKIRTFILPDEKNHLLQYLFISILGFNFVILTYAEPKNFLFLWTFMALALRTAQNLTREV